MRFSQKSSGWWRFYLEKPDSVLIFRCHMWHIILLNFPPAQIWGTRRTCPGENTGSISGIQITQNTFQGLVTKSFTFFFYDYKTVNYTKWDTSSKGFVTYDSVWKAKITFLAQHVAKEILFKLCARACVCGGVYIGVIAFFLFQLLPYGRWADFSPFFIAESKSSNSDSLSLKEEEIYYI